MHVTAKSRVSFRHSWIQGSKGSASFCVGSISWGSQAKVRSGDGILEERRELKLEGGLGQERGHVPVMTGTGSPCHNVGMGGGLQGMRGLPRERPDVQAREVGCGENWGHPLCWGGGGSRGPPGSKQHQPCPAGQSFGLSEPGSPFSFCLNCGHGNKLGLF